MAEVKTERESRRQCSCATGVCCWLSRQIRSFHRLRLRTTHWSKSLRSQWHWLEGPAVAHVPYAERCGVGCGFDPKSNPPTVRRAQELSRTTSCFKVVRALCQNK